MMTKSSQNQVRNSARDIGKIFRPLLTKGIPLYLSRGVSEQDLDALYLMAYNLYSDKKYQEALQIFEAIAFYNHFDKRGWIGSAACCQMLRRYKDAILCYSCASLIEGQDPLPLSHAVECYIALKRYAEARSAIESVLLLTSNNSKFVHLKNWAMKMKEALKNQ